MNEDKTISYIPTTVCVTFKGIYLSEEMTLFGLTYPVLPYLMPVVQCYNCLLF